MLTLPPPPAAALRAAGQVPPARDLPRGGITAESVWTGSVQLSHQMFTLTFDGARRAGLQRNSTPLGWRLVLAGRPAAIDVHAERDGVGYRFAALKMGPHIAATARAVARLSGASELATEDYAMAALLIPSIYISALWLRSSGGATDLFWIVPPANHVAIPARILTADEFELTVADAVNDMLQHHIFR